VAPLAVAAFLLVSATALAAPGQLTQPEGTAGCITTNGFAGCRAGRTLDGVEAIALSPDGRHLYVTSYAVVTLARDTTTGGLAPLAGNSDCVSEDGTNGTCADGTAIGIHSVAVSPDGKNVYTAGGGAVTVFQRNASTGVLTQLPGTAGCWTDTGSPGGQCSDGKALQGAHSVTVSPDGKNVYVASRMSDAVAVFQRDTTTGELAQLAGDAACVSETGGPIPRCRNGKALDAADYVVVSHDGKNVYVASEFSRAIAVFRRNATTGALFQPSNTAGCVSEDGTGGACADGKALGAPYAVALSADGKNVYVGSFSAVAAFRRNATTGALTQLVGPNGKAGCVSFDGSGGQCADGRALGTTFSVAVSPDGGSLYVASYSSDAVAVFRRLPGGALTQLAARTGCVSEEPTTPFGDRCTDGRVLDGAYSVAVSADSKYVYVGAYFGYGVAIFSRELPTGAGS
jgi:DNA-binding beta-propeller fold protein YncE